MSSALDKIQPTKQPRSIGELVQQMGPELQRALPRGMDGDRIARLALTAVRKNPGLEKCTPASFAGALLTSAAMGLEPNVHGEAYLVPYKTECTLIIGYQGLVKLFYNHPLAKHLEAQYVCENDDFDYTYGLHPTLVHRPAVSDRGEIVAYYAAATLTNGADSFVVLSPQEVKDLRQGKVGTSGGIADPQHWMERKTVLRQLFKTLPRSPELNRALDADERTGTELHTELVEERKAIGDGKPSELDASANTQWDDTVEGEVVDE